MVNRAVFQPLPGTILGETDFSIPGEICASDNIRYLDGKIQPIGGWSTLQASTGATGTVVALIEWYSKDGTRRAALGATGSLTVLSGASLGSSGVITPAAFVSATRWTFDIWGDHLIACAKDGKVYEWDLAAAAAVAITNAPTVNTIALVTGTRQVMVLGTKEEASGLFNPRCIRWSATNDNTIWSTTASGQIAGEYVLDGSGGGIRAAKKFGDYVAVWTDDELFLGRFTGDATNPWVFERQAIGCGCLGTDSVTIADGVAYWISTDLRLMGWVPGSAPFELPGSPVSYITGDTSNIDKSGMANSFVWHNRKFNEIWFHPVTTGQTYPTTYIAADIGSLQSQRPVWAPGTLSRSCMYQGINDCYGFKTATTTLVKHETGKHGSGSGDRLSWSASSLVYLDQGQRRVEIQRWLPDVEAQAGNVTLTISKLDYPQGAETTLQTKTLAVGDDKSDFRAGGKLFRFAFSGNDGTGSTDTFARLGRQTFEHVICGDR